MKAAGVMRNRFVRSINVNALRWRLTLEKKLEIRKIFGNPNAWAWAIKNKFGITADKIIESYYYVEII